MCAFKLAAREQTPLLIGLGGQSGSGKTYSALELATGLGGKIAFVDTERGRALHYADRFAFDHDMLTPPFTPERYLEAIIAGEKHVGPGGVVVVDSMSHEWEGVGGLLETAGDIALKMAQRSGGNPEAYTFPSWRDPKQRHQKMVNRMLQLECHLICCFRAKEKLKMMRNAKGKNEPVSQGIQPIMEENLPFEMTFFAVLHPDQPGIPHWTHKALMEGLRPLFRDGQRLDRQLGARLGEWAKGGTPRQERREEDANGHDPETGEVNGQQHAKADADAWWARDSLANPVNGGGWQHWQGRMARAIDAAPTVDALNRLLHDNDASLKQLAADVPKAYEALKATADNAALILLDAEAPVFGDQEPG